MSMEKSKLDELHDIFLNAEKEYLEELMKDPANKKLVSSLSRFPRSFLGKEAVARIERIENGEVPEGELERVETEITLILASIWEPNRDEKERGFRGDDEMDR